MEKPVYKLNSAVFYSNDIKRVVDFYVNFLGLDVEGRQADKYVSFVFANGGRLGIKRAVEEREKPGAQTVFLEVVDIDSLYGQMKGKGAEIIKELVFTEGFGRNFSVLDPDKNKVQFVQL